MNTFFKSAFLIIGICLVLVLYGIYDRQPRYAIVSSGDGYVRIVNVKTGQLYFYNPNEGYEYFVKGQKVIIQSLP